MTDSTARSKAERERARAASDTGKPPRARRTPRAKEIGGPEGPEPTRFGDWERNGRCTDF